MEQGSPEWHKWRAEGIGASEAAVLLGHDPYGKTPFKLWQLKLGLDTKSGGPEALFQRGHETETMVRAAYEFETGLDFGPACFEHSEFPFIRASLDGWNDAEKRGIEIKMVGKEAIKLPPPLHHLIQVQHQMLVTGTSSWVYIRHCEGETKVEVIQEDLTMQRDILAACWQFWSHVQDKTPPPYSPMDWVPDERGDLKVLVDGWRASTTTKERKSYREDILALCAGTKRTLCNGLKISTDPARLTEDKSDATENQGS